MQPSYENRKKKNQVGELKENSQEFQINDDILEFQHGPVRQPIGAHSILHKNVRTFRKRVNILKSDTRSIIKLNFHHEFSSFIIIYFDVRLDMPFEKTNIHKLNINHEHVKLFALKISYAFNKRKCAFIFFKIIFLEWKTNKFNSKFFVLFKSIILTYNFVQIKLYWRN